MRPLWCDRGALRGLWRGDEWRGHEGFAAMRWGHVSYICRRGVLRVALRGRRLGLALVPSGGVSRELYRSCTWRSALGMPQAQEDLVVAAEAANSYSVEAQNTKASAIDTASRTIARLSHAITPRDPRTARERDVHRGSSELEVYKWFCETLQGYQLDERQTQLWRRRFLLNKMNGEALLAIRSDRDLRAVFGVELKGVRVRLLRDIAHERANQSSADNATPMDVWLRQFCYILFATVALGFMLQYLSQILIPVILSFAMTAFMLPIVDALNKRPSRCCASTYPTYCIDGYEQYMPQSFLQGDRRRGCCSSLLRGCLLCIVPRWLATIIAVCVVLALVGLVGLIIAVSVQDGIDNAGNYTEKIEFMINETTAYMIDMGLNQSEIDDLFAQVADPASSIAIGGASTAASAWVDFIIIILFSTYIVIETGGVRQAPGYINARVYRKFLRPLNPNQPAGERRQRLTSVHRTLSKGIQRKVRENYDILISAFDQFDVQGDGLLSPDEFRLGLTRFELDESKIFNINEINDLAMALTRLHEDYRLQKQSTFRARVQKGLSSYMLMKVTFSAVTGLAMALTLLFFDADLWATYGVISFVLNFIPTLGGLIACLLTVPILLIDPDIHFYKGLFCFACVVGIHLLVATVCEPVTFGRQYQVHPVAVLISLMLWVSLWGIVGAFLSTPFLIIVAIGLEHQPHPVAKGLFRAIRGNVGSELPGESTAVPLGPKMRGTLADVDTDTPDFPPQHSNIVDRGSRSSAKMRLPGADDEAGSDSDSDVEHDSNPQTPVKIVVQSVAHPLRRTSLTVTTSDTVAGLCDRLPPEMQMVFDTEVRHAAEKRVEAAEARVEAARQALTDASERAAQLEQDLPTVSSTTISLESEDQIACNAENAEDGPARTTSGSIAKREARNKAKIEKKKGKSSKLIDKAMDAIQQAGDELDEVKKEATEAMAKARYPGCFVFRGVALDGKASSTDARLLGHKYSNEILWLCQNAEEKEELVLDRWCFVPLPSESDHTGKNSNWEVAILTKAGPHEPYVLRRRYHVDSVLSDGSENWLHLEVSSLDDGSTVGVRRFFLEFFRPRWLDHVDQSQIDLRRMFESLQRDPAAFVDFARANISIREPRLWRFAPNVAQGHGPSAFLDRSGSWPLTHQRWVVLFGSEDQTADSRWCVLEICKAGRNGYQDVSVPLPIIEIEPLSSASVEDDNDEIRITVRHPLELCSAAPRTYALSKFSWQYYDSSEPLLADSFSRLCPTPDERKRFAELEMDAKDHAATSLDGEGRQLGSETPDILDFEQQRAAAELIDVRGRLDNKQRQFREFLETNLHVADREQWQWPERARSGGVASHPNTPRSARSHTPRSARSRVSSWGAIP